MLASFATAEVLPRFALPLEERLPIGFSYTDLWGEANMLFDLKME
jgi:hypothetical protein